MFTGIVQAVGKITEIKPLGEEPSAGLHLTIAAGELSLHDVALGDSIALNGACMTVVEKTADSFSIDISRESLNLTTGLNEVGEVNLEKALALGDKLGGHLVSGHVDGLGKVVKFAQVHESWELIISAPRNMAKYLAYKGSIVVNGVSLTVNKVIDTEEDCQFSINLIPHTISVTTLKHLKGGSYVNLEVDLIARYTARMLSLQDTV